MWCRRLPWLWCVDVIHYHARNVCVCPTAANGISPWLLLLRCVPQMPLLQPLSWTGAILPVLPDCILEMVQTPTPLIAGMSKLPEYTPLDEGTVVVHLAAARVDLCDTIAYLQVQIPGITTLYHDLTQFTNNTNHGECPPFSARVGLASQ